MTACLTAIGEFGLLALPLGACRASTSLSLLAAGMTYYSDPGLRL
ncbi:MAG: hypothetical protein WHS87_07730 [Anaerolineales bacterium]